MVHVVHVSQPTSEGVARCVVDLVRHQVAQGIQVTVVCPATGWLASSSVSAGARHVEWAAGRSPDLSVVRETLALRRILVDLQPDLVHTHSAKAGLTGRLAVRGKVLTVYQPHAWSFLAVRGVVRPATLLWERWAVRWTDRIVCVSEVEREQGLAAGLGLQDKVTVVPNGVDLDRYRPGERGPARLRLGVGEGPLAVCVGRLSEQKGQDVLLRAWPAVRAEVPQAQLALVGDGPWLAKLTSLAGDGVMFAGNSSDPRDWYAAADVVVVPSRWEGMALVPLEAAASARSVVITDVAGAREAVSPSSGAVVEVEDPRALAEAVLLRLTDVPGATQEGNAGRQHVADRFSLQVSAGLMDTVYEELLGQTARRP